MAAASTKVTPARRSLRTRGECLATEASQALAVRARPGSSYRPDVDEHDDPTLEPPTARDELLVLAGLVRVMLTADGRLSQRELEHTDELPRHLDLSADEWQRLWEEATRSLPNATRVCEAAARVRPEVRDAVYERLYHLADADGLTDPEWDLLEWLDETWRAATRG